MLFLPMTLSQLYRVWHAVDGCEKGKGGRKKEGEGV